ncbi:vomeronasal type-2 receptor 1-like [Lithobates pipiens]
MSRGSHSTGSNLDPLRLLDEMADVDRLLSQLRIKPEERKKEDEERLLYRLIPQTFPNWLQAFAIMANVVGEKNLEHCSAFFCYLNAIREAYMVYGESAWLRNNEQFQQQRSIHLSLRLDIPAYEYMIPFFLAIDEINKDPKILPNITLGFHLFDTCSYTYKAVDSTLRILTGGRQMGVPNYLCTEGAEVAGFVGDATFLPTLAVAEILNIYQYPQISHGATDLLLSDREKFPNFYRTVPSNWIWYELVMDILKKFGWNWVGIITSSDGTGETELRELRKEMTRRGICIEFVVYLTNNVEINRKRVGDIEKSTTDVVILCGQFKYEYMAFSRESKVLRQNMTLIVNQSWNVVGYKEISLKETFNCSIVAMYALFCIPGLEDYLNNVHPSKRPDDPLLEDIWLNYFKCPSSNNFKNNLNPYRSISNITCTGPESLTYYFTEKHDGKFGFIYTAVYALAHALNNMKLRRNKSGNYGIRKKLNRYVRTVQIKNPVRQTIMFNEKGEMADLLSLVNMFFDPDPNKWNAKIIYYTLSDLYSESMVESEERGVRWKHGKVRYFHCFVSDVF